MSFLPPPIESQSPAELRQFGFILTGGLIAIFGLLLPWLREGSLQGIQFNSWPWYAAAVLLVISLVAPQILGPLHKGWMFIGHILGYINSRIILGLIYLAIFTPVALFFKLTNKDPLQRKLDKQLASYRADSKQPKTDNLSRPY